MGKQPGRSSKNRKPKPAKVVEDRLGPFIPSREDKYLSIDRPPLCFLFKVTGTQRNYTKDSVIASFLPLEDTIRPVALNFPAPLRDLGAQPKAFDHHWERLTYLFDLDNPTSFPILLPHLERHENEAAIRFVKTCRTLAAYSIINDKGGMSLRSKGNGDWSVHSDFPSHEAFTGFAATFRQLHNDGEDGGFSKVNGFFNKAAGGLGDEDARKARAILKTWKDARGELMNTMGATLVCNDLLGPPKALDIEPDPENPGEPRTFRGVVPDEIIRTFNYGDNLHWGDYREQLVELTDDPYNEAFHKHACIAAMTELSHLYFGFAVLLESALGFARVVTPDSPA